MMTPYEENIQINMMMTPYEKNIYSSSTMPNFKSVAVNLKNGLDQQLSSEHSVSSAQRAEESY